MADLIRNEDAVRWQFGDIFSPRLIIDARKVRAGGAIYLNAWNAGERHHPVFAIPVDAEAMDAFARQWLEARQGELRRRGERNDETARPDH